jgi:20S proteasome alpha/beta subunit
MRRAMQASQRTLKSIYHWRTSRKDAARLADEAIRRAKDGDWEGNVYKPKSFRRPRKPH